MKQLLILQQEVTECGLACIAMILKYHRSKVDLNQLRRSFPPSSRGTSLSDLVKIAKNLELQTQIYLLKNEQVATLNLPAILYWDSNHYVVLAKIDKDKGYFILDPAKGSYWCTAESFRKHFTSFAISLKPSRNYAPLKHSRMELYRLLIPYLPNILKNSCYIIALTLLLQVAILIFPFYLQKLVFAGAAIPKANDIIINGALLLLFFKLLESITLFIRGRAIANIEEKMSMTLAGFAFSHLLKLPYSYFKCRSQSTIFNRFNSLEKVRETLSRGLAEGIIDGIFSIIIIGVLFCYDIIIGLLISSLMLLYLATNYYLSKKARETSSVQINERSKEASFFMECISNIIPIKIASRENIMIDSWLNNYQKFLRTSKRINHTQTLLESSRIFIFGFALICLVTLGIELFKTSRLTLAGLYAIIFYFNILTKNIASLTSKYFDIKLCLDHIGNLGDILLAKSEVTSKKPTYQSDNYLIRLKNISYKHSANLPWVIRNFNLTISAGSCVVLFGTSGSGKSTLLKIIAGLVVPTEGQIYFNDILITAENIRWYRRMIAGVMQNDELLSGTVAQNISFYEDPLDNSKLQQCAELAEIHEDISKMPMGYHSYVGDMGISLSGGQRQRILLARALYLNPKILVLDEAFSNLDIETEAKLNKKLQNLKMTRIIVTHRTEPLEFADKVVHINTPSVNLDNNIAAIQ